MKIIGQIVKKRCNKILSDHTSFVNCSKLPILYDYLQKYKCAKNIKNKVRTKTITSLKMRQTQRNRESFKQNDDEAQEYMK